MDISMLKSSFFGYKKSGVCEYIAEINEEFSRKLIDTVKSHDLKEKELNEKIEKLEAENAVLREDRDRVTMIIADAKRFSDELRSSSEAENQKFREDNEAYNADQRRRIEEYCTDIDRIRNSIYRLLNDFDAELSESKKHLTAVEGGLKKLDTCTCTAEKENHEE